MAKLTRNKYVGDPSLNGFRLTLTSGTPVTTADVTGATSIYLTPYRGDHVVLFDGTNYQLYQPAEMSLALGTLADASNYDVWLYPNAGVPTLELSAAWTSDTARNQAIAVTNGVTHKSGDQTRRLVGTIRTTSTTTTEDSEAKRFVSNADNVVLRTMKAIDGTDSWSYTTAAWREARGVTTNRLQFVSTVLGRNPVYARAANNAFSSGGTMNGFAGIGVDSTTVSSAQMMEVGRSGAANLSSAGNATYTGVLLGFHYLSRLEWSDAGDATWYGDAGLPTRVQCGIIGTIWN